MRSPDQLNVILAHDWLTGMRGGERVLEVLAGLFPQAPIYTLIHNPATVSETINRHAITASWLQHVPGIFTYYRYFLPVFPSAIENLQTGRADLLISTSHCVAKGLKPPPGARHLCYCFTPMRYAWVFYDEYFGTNAFKKSLLAPLLQHLRKWDRTASDRVHRFVTLSRHVQERIQRYYGREADVVYPPVNTDYWTPDPQEATGPRAGCELGTYDLIVSALVPYKRINLAVDAYTRLGFPLKIVGTGTEFRRLRVRAGRQIEFTGRLTDDAIRDLYRHCRALIFPGVEDFGIVPVEAQACGRPVVAYGRGGVLESVIDGATGVFFNEQTAASLLNAIERMSGMLWQPQVIRANAERFSETRFIRGIMESIGKCMT